MTASTPDGPRRFHSPAPHSLCPFPCVPPTADDRRVAHPLQDQVIKDCGSHLINPLLCCSLSLCPIICSGEASAHILTSPMVRALWPGSEPLSQLPSTGFEVDTLDTRHHLRNLEPGPPTQPPPSGPTDTHMLYVWQQVANMMSYLFIFRSSLHIMGINFFNIK